MKHSQNYLLKSRPVVLLCSVLLFLTFCFLASTRSSSSQNADKLIKKQDRLIEKQAFSNEPVKISVVKTKKGVVKPGEKFSDDDDWFKGLKVIVENVSDKPVTYVRVGIIFHRPKGLGATQDYPYGESLTYGVDPFSPEGSGTVNQAKAIAPGKSIELALPDEIYNGTKEVLKKLKFPESIKRIEITVETVGFEDGTAWSAGQLWRRDPGAPKGWRPIEKPQGSAINGTAKFFPTGLGSSKWAKAALSHRAPRLEPLPVQLPETYCGQVGPEWYSQCGEVPGCRYYNRDFYGETGFGQRVEVYVVYERCRMPDNSFCVPTSQVLVNKTRTCPLPSPTPTPTPEAHASRLQSGRGHPRALLRLRRVLGLPARRLLL